MQIMEEPTESQMRDHELLKLDDHTIGQLSKEIRQGLDSWMSTVTQHQTRWDAWEAMYNDDVDSSGQPPEGFKWPHFPLIRPHIRSLVASMTQAITSYSPWVQFVATKDASVMLIEPGPDGEPIPREVPGTEVMSQAAEIVHNVIQKHGAVPILKQVLKNAFIQGGRGIMRVAPSDEEDDAMLVMEAIDARNFCFDPPYIKHLWDERIHMVGHRELVPKHMLDEMIMRGELYDVSLSASSNEAETVRTAEYSFGASNEDNEAVHLWELYKKCSLKEGEPRRWYRILYAGVSEQILAVYEHELGYQGYIDFAEEPENNKFLKGGSIAGSLSPIQHMYTNALGTLDLGTQMTAFPYIFGIGLSTNEFKPKVGTITPVPHGVEIQVVQVPFNPSIIPQLLEKLEEVAGTITGTSRASTGGELSSNTTATEAQGYFSAQSKTEQGYLNDIAPSIERLYATVHMMLLTHPEWAQKVLYGIAEDNWPKILEGAVGCRYVLAGNVLTNSVLNRQQLVSSLLPLSSDPEFGINKYELARFTIDTMADGAAKTTLQLSKEEVDAQIAQQQAIALAGMVQERAGSGGGAKNGKGAGAG